MTARLGLGTVQFGMPYGATNTGGQVPVAEVGAILHAAAAIGIDLLDTAAGYGTAEQALGAALRPEHRFAVVTKTLRLDRPVVSRDDVGHLIQAVHQSLRALNRPRVEGLLVKSAADLTAPGGDLLVDALRRVQAEGYVGRLGLSLYPDDPLDAVLARFTPDIVQLPLSVLDRRVLDNGMLLRLRDAGVEIHVRSALNRPVVSPFQAPACRSTRPAGCRSRLRRALPAGRSHYRRSHFRC
jgi:aryl-alcohol dehydrogenase-like predicted oxidoreductase